MRNFFFSPKKTTKSKPEFELEMTTFSVERGDNSNNLLVKQPWMILVAIFIKLYDRSNPMEFFDELNKLRLVCLKFKDMHIDFFKNICESRAIRELFFPSRGDYSSFKLVSHADKSQRILLEMESFKKLERHYRAKIEAYKKISAEKIDAFDIIFSLFHRETFMFTLAAYDMNRAETKPLEKAACLNELQTINPYYFKSDETQLINYDLDVAYGIVSHINYLFTGLTQHASFVIFMSLLIAGDCAFLFNAYLNYQKSRLNNDKYLESISYYYFLALYNDSVDILRILSMRGVNLSQRVTASCPADIYSAIAQEIADKYLPYTKDFLTKIILNDPVMICLYFKSKKALQFLIENKVETNQKHLDFAKKIAPELLTLLSVQSKELYTSQKLAPR